MCLIVGERGSEREEGVEFSIVSVAYNTTLAKCQKKPTCCSLFTIHYSQGRPEKRQSSTGFLSGFSKVQKRIKDKG